MKKARLLFTLLSLCFLLGCNSVVPDGSKPPSASETTADSALKMPDEMKEFVENPNVQWMAGMLAVIENAEMTRGISPENFEMYTDPGDEIRAAITVQNGLDLTQRFELMVFSDGIPVEFTVEGQPHLSYSVSLIPQPKTLKIHFQKEFTLNLGRLDFVLSFAENPQENYHLVSYTVWIDQNGEPQIPASLCPTVEQRRGLQGNYTGAVYDAWIWSQGVIPTDIDSAGEKEINLQNGETFLLEAVAAKPGLYRTVLVIDETPVTFELNGTQYTFLDWESTGTNMIQLPIKLADIPSHGSIYTVTTPLDADTLAQPIAASGRIELFRNEGNQDGTED